MASAESENLLLRAVLRAAARATCVLFGTTIVALWLLRRIDRTPDSESGFVGLWSDYWASFGDAVTPSSQITGAFGRTLVLAAAGILLGLIAGSVFGLLMRIPKLKSILALASLPAMALAIPGIALYPLARAAISLGWSEEGPVSLNTSLSDGLAFVSLWGLLAGLAIAPTVASVVAGVRTSPALGPHAALNWSAARSEAVPGPKFALPTTAFVLALATAEVLSNQLGVFSRLFAALESRSLVEVFQIVFWLAIAAAVLVTVIELAAYFLGGEQPAGDQKPVATATSTSLLMPTIVVLTFLVAVALAGLFANQPARNAEAVLVGPSFGGPWLGTDVVGRGLAHLSSAGLWPALVAGFVPAAIATVAGTAVALLATAGPRRVGQTVDIAIDALWWPAPSILPLAFVALGQGARWGHSWGFLTFTGLMLTPMAARLMARTALGDVDRRAARLVSALFFCAAVAMSMHLMLGLVGFGGGDERPQLGTAIRTGLATYDSSLWPYLVPAVAAALLITAIYAVAESLTVPKQMQSDAASITGTEAWSRRPTEPGLTPPIQHDLPQSADEAGAIVSTGSVDPEIQSDPDSEPDSDSDSEPDSHPDTVPAAPELPTAQPQPAQASDLSSIPHGIELELLPDLPPRQASDGEPKHGEPKHGEPKDGESTDAGPADAEGDSPLDPESESESIMERASKTIELRPSKLRAAGIVASTDAVTSTSLTDKWSKPELATRPDAASVEPVTEIEDEPEGGIEVEAAPDSSDEAADEPSG